ncbi:MAG: glutamate-5-semialdehyde dehydrogenase [Candidatus Berkiellales bacterium]
MNEIQQKIQATKKASRTLLTLNNIERNKVLTSLADELLKNTNPILKANAEDLAKMPTDDPRYDRLLLTQERIDSMAQDIRKVTQLPDPLGQVLLEKTLPNGLALKKISVPLGVVSVIYESRPNVTIDVFVLCFKAGNACILKGGKEAWHTNQALMKIIHQTLLSHSLPTELAYLMPPERERTFDLLNAVGLIDVCIPRGSQALIDFVRSHAKIPVIETGAGIVHTYFDQSGDLTKGKRIIDNAKTRRVSVCNALDTLLIHQARLNDLSELIAILGSKNVEIFADDPSVQILKAHYPKHLLHHAKPEDYGTEFLSLKMSIKVVNSLDEAIAHIAQYSSGHSEAIIAEDPKVYNDFLANVDAAAVYVNASTAFTDGGEFGMGAEIGISTQKLHARGPMGLEALTSYKWEVLGDGQVRNG